jgi:hypothetical protein
MAAVFSCAGTEESFTETVPLSVVSSDATPDTVDLDALDVVEAAGEFGESTLPQPVTTMVIRTVQTVRRARMFFLII